MHTNDHVVSPTTGTAHRTPSTRLPLARDPIRTASPRTLRHPSASVLPIHGERVTVLLGTGS